jgi:hypothetical protein
MYGGDACRGLFCCSYIKETISPNLVKLPCQTAEASSTLSQRLMASSLFRSLVGLHLILFAQLSIEQSWSTDLPAMKAQPGYSNMQDCSRACLTGFGCAGGATCGNVWQVANCDTSVCMCSHFDVSLLDIIKCVPSACTSTVELPVATSILYSFCSNVMGLGWVAPAVNTQRTFTGATTNNAIAVLPTTVLVTTIQPLTTTSLRTLTPIGISFNRPRAHYHSSRYIHHTH